MRLHLAADVPTRLLAAGVPDWLGADGLRIGWALRDVLFWLEGGEVFTLQLPDVITDVCPGPSTWTVAMALGVAEVDLSTRAVRHLLSVDAGDPLEVLPGEGTALVVAVPESAYIRVGDGAAIELPFAATRARFAAPFSQGAGLVWIDRERLFRQAEGGAPCPLGPAGGVEALAIGPSGVVLAAVESDTLCVASPGIVRRLGQEIDVEGARFSPDGRLALAADEAGVVEVDLATARVLRRWDGAAVPVGYAPGPVRWERTTGRLVDAEGAAVAQGFAGASPSCRGGWLAGPGGAVRRLTDGVVLRADLGEGTAATDGVRVVVVDDTVVHVLDGATFAHGLVAGEDGVDLVRVDEDRVTVQTFDGQAAAFSLDGTERWRRRDRRAIRPESWRIPGVRLGDPEESSLTLVDDRSLAIPADGAARVGGSVWLWSEEGMLVAVD